MWPETTSQPIWCTLPSSWITETHFKTIIPDFQKVPLTWGATSKGCSKGMEVCSAPKVEISSQLRHYLMPLPLLLLPKNNNPTLIMYPLITLFKPVTSSIQLCITLQLRTLPKIWASKEDRIRLSFMSNPLISRTKILNSRMKQKTLHQFITQSSCHPTILKIQEYLQRTTIKQMLELTQKKTIWLSKCCWQIEMFSTRKTMPVKIQALFGSPVAPY